MRIVLELRGDNLKKVTLGELDELKGALEREGYSVVLRVEDEDCSPYWAIYITK